MKKLLHQLHKTCAFYKKHCINKKVQIKKTLQEAQYTTEKGTKKQQTKLGCLWSTQLTFIKRGTNEPHDCRFPHESVYILRQELQLQVSQAATSLLNF